MAHTKGIESTTKISTKQRLPQTPPKVGSYRSAPAEQAANRVEAWPGSKAPGRDSNNNQVTSGRPAQRGPFQSDSSSWPEWLDPAKPLRADRSTKPDLMRG